MAAAATTPSSRADKELGTDKIVSVESGRSFL
jgi:hypothetical protein